MFSIWPFVKNLDPEPTSTNTLLYQTKDGEYIDHSGNKVCLSDYGIDVAQGVELITVPKTKVINTIPETQFVDEVTPMDSASQVVSVTDSQSSTIKNDTSFNIPPTRLSTSTASSVVYMGTEKSLVNLPSAGCKKKDCQPDFGENHVLNVLNFGKQQIFLLVYKYDLFNNIS